MSKEKLNNLIDKVIGKVGPLRIPAYWMNKLLKDFAEWVSKNEGSLAEVDSKVNEAKASIPTKVSQLENDEEYAPLSSLPKVYNPMVTAGDDIVTLQVTPFNVGVFNSILETAELSVSASGEYCIYVWLDRDSIITKQGTSKTNLLPDNIDFGCYRILYLDTDIKQVVLARAIPDLSKSYVCALYSKSDSAVKLFSESGWEAYYNGESVPEPELPSLPRNTKILLINSGRVIAGFSSIVNLKEAQILNAETIESYAFSRCSNLESVKLPESLTRIRSQAFFKCNSLKELEIPDSVNAIGQEAFYECSSLRKVNIPESVTAIGNYLFAYCENLSEITVGSNIQAIGYGVFAECNSLPVLGGIRYADKIAVSLVDLDATEVVFEDGTQYIGNYVFSDTNNLSKLSIPDSVTLIANRGSGVFNGCVSVREFSGKFTKDGVAIIYDDCLARVAPKSEINEFTIPDTVKLIGQRAFQGVTSLTSIAFPSSVREIENNAFDGCVFDTVTIPATIDSAYNAFSNARGKKLIIQSNTLLSRSHAAYYSGWNEDSLFKRIVVSNKVRTIGEYNLSRLKANGLILSITDNDGTDINGNSKLNIKSNALYVSSALKFIHITDSVSNLFFGPYVTLSSSSSLYGIPKDCVIVITPVAAGSAYENATNWASYSDRMISAESVFYFEVGGTLYIAEANYTWQEYIESKFCNGPFTVVDGLVVYNANSNVQYAEENVKAEDLIISDAAYVTVTIPTTE